jgi:predicted ATPase
MSIFLHGLILKNYRGIGENFQICAPFKECNFFIGKNNSGKSTFLNFISTHLAEAQNYSASLGGKLTMQPLEVHLGSTEHQVEFGFGVPIEEARTRFVHAITQQTGTPGIDTLELLEKLLKRLARDDIIWTAVGASALNQCYLLNSKEPGFDSILEHRDWQKLWGRLTGMNGGNFQAWYDLTLGRLIELLRLAYPSTRIIPAKRQIGAKGKNFGDFSGEGLIDKLAELQNPGPTDRRLREVFLRINAFLQEVTGDSEAMIEIPHDRTEVLVHKDQRVLPLSSLGTGIHEVVMIAAFCTLTEKSIVCIEEPEIHLHPLLQKKLIKYVIEKTNNQYFIATHSASIIDYPGAAVFHVNHVANTTTIESAVDSVQRFRVCQDLGYRASDLLQTNAIIWVEGPSDRIYIKHWIASINKALKEGIHYSVMFYGGRLLSHLSASDEEVSEFILLRKLNNNMAIVIDSDKKAPASKINDTKKRVIQEFTKHGEPVWLTAGREIENYIPDPILESALRQLYGDFLSVESVDRYSHRLHYLSAKKGAKIVEEVDKVKVARIVCHSPADLTVLDLKEQITKIVRMIEKANA